MTRLAAADDPRFSVSTLEVEREGPSYTYETLELLAEERGDTELVFVMGADAAVGLESWREPERVVELARLAVARRAGRLRRRGRRGAAQPRRRGPGDDAGDAAVRRLLLGGARAGGGGRPLRYLVPEPVARFIEEKGIYSMSSDRARRGAGAAAGRARRLERGDGHRRPRHARARLLHRLPGDLHGAQRAPGAGDRRRGEAAAEERAGAAAGRRRRGGGGRLDRPRLPRLPSSTSSPRRRGSATSSRTSGARRRGSSWSSPPG